MTMYLIFFLVSFLASIVGSICGIGGGVLIKPILDATGVMGVSAVSFLSGCTVLSMSLVSIGRSVLEKKLEVKMDTTLPLAFGAAAGGILGRTLFQFVKALVGSEKTVGLVQAVVLLLITALTFVYTIKKENIRTWNLTGKIFSFVIGMVLGCMSVFLGIGGGPINLMVLSFFFSMDTKKAAANSLFIILISQIAGFAEMFIKQTVPQVPVLYLILMVAGGILGATWGRHFNKKLDNAQVTKLFEILMIIIMGINVFNIIKFM